MASLMPGYFKGETSEDSEGWWKEVERWCRYKNLDNENRVGLIPLLLKDSAKLWFESLPETTSNSFTEIKEAFLNQFRRSDGDRWRDVAAAWETIQQPNQSVENYIFITQQKAASAKMNEEQTRHIIMNGLHTHIRNSIIHHDISTVANIKMGDYCRIDPRRK